MVIPEEHKCDWFEEEVFGTLALKLPTDFVIRLAQLIRRLKNNQLLKKCYKLVRLPSRLH